LDIVGKKELLSSTNWSTNFIHLLVCIVRPCRLQYLFTILARLRSWVFSQQVKFEMFHGAPDTNEIAEYIGELLLVRFAFVIVWHSAGAQRFARRLHELDLVRGDWISKITLYTFVVRLLEASPSSGPDLVVWTTATARDPRSRRNPER
jgi:hypothetical protein